MSNKSDSSVTSDNNSMRKSSWLSAGHGRVGGSVGFAVAGTGNVGRGVGGRVRGSRVGRVVSSVGTGETVGGLVGSAVIVGAGEMVGAVGSMVGAEDSVGAPVGSGVGGLVGIGKRVGRVGGRLVGVGTLVGVGNLVGDRAGARLGVGTGSVVGSGESVGVGTLVGVGAEGILIRICKNRSVPNASCSSASALLVSSSHMLANVCRLCCSFATRRLSDDKKSSSAPHVDQMRRYCAISNRGHHILDAARILSSMKVAWSVPLMSAWMFV